MGKGSLIVVFSAVLAGSAVLFNVQMTGRDAEAQQTRFSEDVIARTNAESARQQVASMLMAGEDVKGEAPSIASNGGWMQVKDVRSAGMGGTGYFTVEGRSAGRSAKGTDAGAAVHRIRTEYRALTSMDWPTTIGANGFPTYLKNKSNHPDSSGQIIMGASQKTYVDMQGFWELVNKPGVGLDEDDYRTRRTSILETLQAAGVEADQVVFTGEGEQTLYDAAAEADLDAVLRSTFLENNPGIANEDAQDHFGLGWFYQQVKYGDVMQPDRDFYMGPGESDAPFVWTAEEDLRGEARIFYVERDVVIQKGASLQGEGLLLVDGDFVVEKGATFDWKGLVMVRGEEEKYRKIDLGGDVNINGAVFGMQDAHDPGGHMDVTVWGAPAGDWTHPYGEMETIGSKELGCGTMPGCQPSDTEDDGHRPWWEHTHKYDLNIGGAAGYKIPFIRNSSAPSNPYRGKLRMNDLLDRLPGSEEYYLQFGDGAEVRNSGYAHFSVDIRGANAWSATDRSIQDGFESGAATYQSPTFKPDELHKFELEVGSLQGLAKLWNEAAQDCYWGANYRKCPRLSPDYEEGQVTDYPVWVGNDKERRQGSFTVKLRRAADDAVVYEAAAYWHKKPSEQEEEEEESEALGDEIMAGGTQGLDVYLGPNAKINSSDPDAMLDLGGLFNITNQTNVQPLRVAAQHFSPGEPGHVYGDNPYAKPYEDEESSGGDDNTPVTVCHRGKTDTFTMKKYRDHSDHTKMGACSADDDDDD